MAGFAPCFPVRDLRAALAHYQQLGFEVMPYAPGMAWAWARLGPAELHPFTKTDHDPATTAAAAQASPGHPVRPGVRARRPGQQPHPLRHPGRRTSVARARVWL